MEELLPSLATKQIEQGGLRSTEKDNVNLENTANMWFKMSGFVVLINDFITKLYFNLIILYY